MGGNNTLPFVTALILIKQEKKGNIVLAWYKTLVSYFNSALWNSNIQEAEH